MSVGLQPRGDGRAAKSLFPSSRHLFYPDLLHRHGERDVRGDISFGSDISSHFSLPRSTYVPTQPCFRMLMDSKFLLGALAADGCAIRYVAVLN